MNNLNLIRIWKFGDDVDTDQIVPGRFSPYMNPDINPGDVAFIEARPEFRKLLFQGSCWWPEKILAAVHPVNMLLKH